MDINGEKRGFLNENFKMFYLKDKKEYSFEYHFHDFLKVVIMLSGDVTYLIEGKAYKMKPWDILFISNNEIHKPIINSNSPYERFILWINSDYLSQISSNKWDLSNCFTSHDNTKLNLLRLGNNTSIIQDILYEMHREKSGDLFGNEQLLDALFIKLIVQLNRLTLESSPEPVDTFMTQDENISNILKYINDNIILDLNIDMIAKEFFMNRYYLMHKFKEFTGFTINNYVTQKRLILASRLLREGSNPSKIFSSCGFKDYSNFYRCFKKFFGISPSEYKKLNT